MAKTCINLIFVFTDICLRDEASTTYKTTTSEIKTYSMNTTLLTTPTTTPSTVRVTELATVTESVTSTTPRSTSTIKVIPKMPQRVPIFNQSDVNELKTTEAPKDYEDVGNNIEDEHDVEQDDIFLPTATYESDNIINEKFMMKTKSDGVNVSLIIKVLVIVVSTVFLSLLVFLVVYKQYKKSTNPLNYKEKQENGSKKANEEFSEIRFLTSDETLDFNLATPDSSSTEL